MSLWLTRRMKVAGTIRLIHFLWVVHAIRSLGAGSRSKAEFRRKRAPEWDGVFRLAAVALFIRATSAASSTSSTIAIRLPGAMRGWAICLLCVVYLLACLGAGVCKAQDATPPDGAAPAIVGSKAFTESVILGEILVQSVLLKNTPAEHRRNIGGTRILFEALRRGDIDAYVEYTGTLSQELLASTPIDSLEEALSDLGVSWTQPLGFNNTYAIGMKPEIAESLGIRTISDLRGHHDLTFGFANEFMDRRDGWPSLRARYELPQTNVRGLDHDLAYRALDDGAIAATDLYSTDAEIRQYGLVVLEDDLAHFPDYHAVVLYRTELEAEAPEAVRSWEALAGTIDEETMIALNARVKLDGVPEQEVAADFLEQTYGRRTAIDVASRSERILARLGEHLVMVGLSVAGAILLGIPLGIWAAKRPAVGHGILGVVGVVQTVPSLALLVFMIPLLGIGTGPAIAALFLYSLLPIVRNTHQGITGIPADLVDSSRALGLPIWTNLWRIELPLASPAILAGIKTAAVISVGTATLGALIGAGGFGQPILTGIRLADTGLILEGAIPAALLALASQFTLDLAERVVVPEGLRLSRGR
jgi:osmoprotectant transport system permease protein